MSDWFTISTEQIYGIILTTFFIYILLMIVVRINGLRSFSKMSGHDFAITVAIGSILASTVISQEPSLLQGILAISALLTYQTLFSLWRIRRVKQYLENTPVFLMQGSKILEDNMKKNKITESDLMAKLREANVLDINEVQAVVLEQTGDISVLSGNKSIEPKIIWDVASQF